VGGGRGTGPGHQHLRAYVGCDIRPLTLREPPYWAEGVKSKRDRRPAVLSGHWLAMHCPQCCDY
jgi:hypothetical protein